MFDALIREAADKFGLGNNASKLVGSLVQMVFNPSTGGFGGFQQKFASAGLGDLFTSWLGGGGGGGALQPDQLGRALGTNALSGIATKLGMPSGVINLAVAGLLPKLIGLLTPGGQIPTSIPAAASSLISGLDTRPDPPHVAPRAKVVEPERSNLGWLKWLIPLAILLGLGFCMLNRKKPVEVAPAVVPAPVATAPVVETPPVAPMAEVRRDAAAALAALQGNFTANDLVGALNLADIQFDTDSANISASSQAILATAAEAIKRAPAGTRVEIGGHTDNTGDPAANLTLSEARANAVRTRLGELGVADGILTAKGYGADRPKADNATDAGRAQNRRMEFTVVQ